MMLTTRQMNTIDSWCKLGRADEAALDEAKDFLDAFSELCKKLR